MAKDRLSVSGEVTRLAGSVLGVGDDITDAAGNAVGDLAVPGSAFGNTPGAADLHRAHAEAVDTAVSLGSKLAEVLEGDADRLYKTAFAFKKADEDAARDVKKRVTR